LPCQPDPAARRNREMRMVFTEPEREEITDRVAGQIRRAAWNESKRAASERSLVSTAESV